MMDDHVRITDYTLFRLDPTIDMDGRRGFREAPAAVVFTIQQPTGMVVGRFLADGTVRCADVDAAATAFAGMLHVALDGFDGARRLIGSPVFVTVDIRRDHLRLIEMDRDGVVTFAPEFTPSYDDRLFWNRVGIAWRDGLT